MNHRDAILKHEVFNTVIKNASSTAEKIYEWLKSVATWD
jgi:hypothetical protein